MKYDFTSIMDRHGKDAIAVDGLGTGFAPAAPKEGFDAIPMWVADMNFPTVPTIQEAIIERTNHPAFGYFNPTDEYFDSIIRWQAKRNGVQGLTKECIGYENGVLGGRDQRPELRLLQGRQDPDPQPHLHRLHHEPEEQRLRGCPQPAGQG